jgi:hypothetical protein
MLSLRIVVASFFEGVWVEDDFVGDFVYDQRRGSVDIIEALQYTGEVSPVTFGALIGGFRGGGVAKQQADVSEGKRGHTEHARDSVDDRVVVYEFFGQGVCADEDGRDRVSVGKVSDKFKLGSVEARGFVDNESHLCRFTVCVECADGVAVGDADGGAEFAG